MHKYMPAARSPASNKRPNPSPCLSPRVERDASPSDPRGGTKRTKTTATIPPSSATGLEISPPDREGSDLDDRESSEDPKTPDSADYRASPRAETEDPEFPWPVPCLLNWHTTNVVGLSAELLKLFMSPNDPSVRAEPTHAQAVDIIDRAESAAGLFLHVHLDGNALQLYALILQWAVDYKGPLCHCVRKLVLRARIGCARSALARSDIEEASLLLEQTKSLFPPGRSTEQWLLYESIFTWRLYRSRGVLQLDGEKDAIRRLQTKFKSIDFFSDPSPYKTLGIMACYEILSVIPERDAKLHIVDLELGERHDDDGSVSPESPSLEIHPSDLTCCLRWMHDLPASRQSDQVPLMPRNHCVVRCNRIGSFDVHFGEFFSLCWTQLQSQVTSTAPSWFQKPKSMGIQPTELLAVMVHLVIAEGPPPTAVTNSMKQLRGIRRLLFLDKSRLLIRFNKMRFQCTLVSSINQLSRNMCPLCFRESWARSDEAATAREYLRVALDPVFRASPATDTSGTSSLADLGGPTIPWSTTMDFPSLTESVPGSLPLTYPSGPRPPQHVTTSQPRHETAHPRGSTSAPYSLSPKNAALPSSSMTSTIPPTLPPTEAPTPRIILPPPVLPGDKMFLPSPSPSQANYSHFPSPSWLYETPMTNLTSIRDMASRAPLPGTPDEGESEARGLFDFDRFEMWISGGQVGRPSPGNSRPSRRY